MHGAVELRVWALAGIPEIVAGDDLATVSPNADVLSQLGEAPSQTLRADEALPMVAISTGASLVPAAARIKPAEQLRFVIHN